MTGDILYHKLDFTRAPVIYEDADFWIRLSHWPMHIIRQVKRQSEREMGENSYFLMCGDFYDPVIESWWMASGWELMYFPCGYRILTGWKGTSILP